ncbi:MAG: tetratricopeptide repeat protein [Chloroflexales bacterium]|nr:tetratricopeptide repeat protein [Chloroflexales bacterium]
MACDLDEATVGQIDALNRIAWELSDIDASRSRACAEAAYALAEAGAESGRPDRAGMAYSLRTQGYLNQRSGSYAAGMAQLLAALALFEELQAGDGPACADGLIDVFDGLAGIHGQMGNLPESLDYSYKMLSLAEASGDRRRMANARNNLATIFTDTGEHERAVALLEQNAREAAAIGYSRIETLAHLNLATIHLHAGNPEAALEQAEAGLQTAREGSFELFAVYALDLLGQISFKLDDAALAIAYLEQALEASRQIGSRVTEALNLLNLGTMHTRLGRREQACDVLQACLAVAESIDAKPEQLAAHLALSELYERHGEPALALAHFKQHHALKERVTGERAAERMSVLQVAHETETARREAVAYRQQADELQRIVDERTAELRNLVASLEQRVAARTAEVATFFDLTLLAGQAGDLADVFLQVLPRIIEATHSAAVSVHLFDEERASLNLIGQLNLASELAPNMAVAELAQPFQRWLAYPADPLLTTDLAAFASLPPELKSVGLPTYLGAQIKIGQRVEGVLGCYHASGYGYGIDEVALVTALAEQIGMLLAARQLRQQTWALAIVEERRRLARDLHDSVSQSLYSLGLFAETVREAAEDADAERLSESLDQLQQTTVGVLGEMRLLLYELRPADLQREGLALAIRRRLESVERRTNLRLAIALDELPGLAPEFEVELYYIVVEALNNTLKHAAATSLSLLLTQRGGQVQLRIDDNGRGFDPAQTTGGMGLRNLGERVARLNGSLQITSAPGHGTTVEVLFPLNRGG